MSYLFMYMDYIKLLINFYFYISVKLVETQVLHI